MLTLSLGFSCIFVCAQFEIDGFVFDCQTGEAISDVQIELVELGNWTISDANGKFFFSQISIDRLSINFYHIAYKKKTYLLNHSSGDMENISISLQKKTLQLHDISIYGQPDEGITLTEKDLKNHAGTSLSAVLSESAGVAVIQGQLPTVQIEGASSEQILVIVDGMRYSGSDAAERLSELQTDEISKITVLKGNQSARYGSNAIGGVILIQTKPNFEQLFYMRGTLGNFSRYSGYAKIGLSFGKFWASAFRHEKSEENNFSYIYHHDDGRIENGIRENCDINQTTTGANLKIGEKLLYFTRHSESEWGLPGPLDQTTPVAIQIDSTHEHGFALNFAHLTISGKTEQRHRTFQDSITPQYHTTSVFGNTSLNGRFVQNWDDGGIELNAFYQRENFELVDHMDKFRPPFLAGSIARIERAQNHWGFSVWVDKTVARLWLKNLYFRWDYGLDLVSRFPLFSANRFAFRANFDAISVGFASGDGFRVPSVSDLFWPAGVHVQGNPNLLPEISNDFRYQISVRLFESLKIKAETFHKIIENQIIWQKDFAGKYSPQNISTAEIDGQSYSFRFLKENFPIKCRLNIDKFQPINRSEDPITNGNFIPFRILSKTSFETTIQTKFGEIAYEIEAIGKIYIRSANTKPLDGFRQHNLQWQKQIASNRFGWFVLLRVENLADKTFATMERYPLPGRCYFLTIKTEIMKGKK